MSRATKLHDREPITINSRDAAARNIRDGDVVKVFNQRGAMLAGAIVSDNVRSGVAQIATGAWYDPVDAGEIGSLDKHGNPNVLTPDVGTSRLAQGCAAQTTWVQIERWEQALPPVTAFDPPKFVRRDWRATARQKSRLRKLRHVSDLQVRGDLGQLASFDCRARDHARGYLRIARGGHADRYRRRNMPLVAEPHSVLDSHAICRRAAQHAGADPVDLGILLSAAAAGRRSRFDNIVHRRALAPWRRLYRRNRARRYPEHRSRSGRGCENDRAFAFPDDEEESYCPKRCDA